MIDAGTAYGRKPSSHDPSLTEAGPRTPMGELMRRYWQPVGVAADASDLPREVRALGEDLILFRGKNGNDTHFRIFTVLRGADDAFFRMYDKLIADRHAAVEADPTCPQRIPNNLDAQGSQGPITVHGEEHLTSSDRGVVMLRRLYRRQMDIVAGGGDPLGVAFEPGAETRKIEAGAFLTPVRVEAA